MYSLSTGSSNSSLLDPLLLLCWLPYSLDLTTVSSVQMEQDSSLLNSYVTYKGG